MPRLVSKLSEENARCINCFLRVKRIKSYTYKEINETMMSVLCSWISPTPITPDVELCKECYHILQSIDEEEPIPPPMFGHTNVCFGCGISLHRVRSHNVTLECPERQIINQYVIPHLVDRLTKVCHACWLTAKNRGKIKSEREYTKPSFYQVEVKIERDISESETDIVEIQADIVKEYQKNNIVTNNVHTEIKLENDIKLNNVESQADIVKEDQKNTILANNIYTKIKLKNDIIESDIVESQTDIVKEEDHKVINVTNNIHTEIKIEYDIFESDIVENKAYIVKEDDQENTIVPSNIHTEIKLENDIVELDIVENPAVTSDDQINDIVQTVQIESYTRVPDTSSCCFFNNCKGQEILMVPQQLREIMLCQHKIYIPLASRICSKHLTENNSKDAVKYDCNEFTLTHMDDMQAILTKACTAESNFDNIYMISPALCQHWFGMSACNFYSLLLEIPNLQIFVPSASRALSMFLIRVVRKDSLKALSKLFLVSRTTVIHYITAVQVCIAEELGLSDEEGDDYEIIHDYIKSYIKLAIPTNFVMP